jgi:broad specificity phosphatase PhoE
MGRHGEGDHNVAEAFYGTKDWDDYWSKLEGNGTVSWADAHLTETGKQQALTAHAFIDSQISKREMPAPQSYYVSPMYRCLQTASLTYSELKLPEDRPFAPVIKELVREVLGEHTCDRRSTKTYIHNAYPEWSIEPGFTENDELWKADHRETFEEHDVRTRKFLNDLFANDRNVYISLTSHSGAIASHLRVLGHREFKLPTGGMIPVMVKATRVLFSSQQVHT